jgi:MFS family permease
VAQRALIERFASTLAVVAWTVAGYTLALAAAIPLTGWKSVFLINIPIGVLALIIAGFALPEDVPRPARRRRVDVGIVTPPGRRGG